MALTFSVDTQHCPAWTGPQGQAPREAPWGPCWEGPCWEGAVSQSHARHPALAHAQHPDCLHPTPQVAALSLLPEGEAVTKRPAGARGRTHRLYSASDGSLRNSGRLAWSWDNLV